MYILFGSQEGLYCQTRLHMLLVLGINLLGEFEQPKTQLLPKLLKFAYKTIKLIFDSLHLLSLYFYGRLHQFSKIFPIIIIIIILAPFHLFLFLTSQS